ncbi:MAG: excinuclease ABC subunit UvrB, partial [bacterium]
MQKFELISDYKPTGDQPQAIEWLINGAKKGEKFQTLLGVTGSGKTFTVANVVAAIQKPTLVIAPNKTLAAQLCQEFRQYFPKNAVEYFVSYYDYYQPEAYIAHTDTYIEKDSAINEQIDRLRHRATMSLIDRKDVLIVASVSCIYGLGTPEDYSKAALVIKAKDKIVRDNLLKNLVEIKYERNDLELSRGKFRARGDIVEVFPSYAETIIRIEFFGEEVDRIVEIHPIEGTVLSKYDVVNIYPATHFVTFRDEMDRAMSSIEGEIEERVKWFKDQGKLIEAQRIEQRTKYDLEMMRETGYCKGIENYSRHLTGRAPGQPPATLLEYFPDDFIMFIDESHITVPQIRGMYEGDKARKLSLIEHGFRLPSAADNRPLNFTEFEGKLNQVVFVSATPADYEMKHSRGKIVEQIIRPTGLIDPEVIVRKTKGQVEDLLKEIQGRVANKERVLVTTLTKRMSEDLAEYMEDKDVKVRYLHSDIETLDRIDILRGLRLGEFDVLVGINLLREGLDLPEVSLVAILDADKEGFLRSQRSLIQTIGRAARNVAGQVILYGDTVTGSMREALNETNRRRRIQMDYNQKHNITPRTIVKEIHDIKQGLEMGDVEDVRRIKEFIPQDELPTLIAGMEEDMRQAAIELEFEKAAKIRDQI